MAFPVTKIQLSDKLKVLRAKYNELIDAFEDFSFSLNGDLIFQETLNQNGERLTVNYDETQAGSIDKLPGIEIERGTVDNQVLVWDESDDLWKVGTADSLIALSLTDHLHDDDYYRTDEDIILNGSKIINQTGEDGFTIDNGNVTIVGDIAAKNIVLEDSTIATGLTLYNTYTDITNYEKGELKFDSDILKIGVSAEGTGTLPEMGFVQTGLIKMYTYQANVLDDGTITLPLIINSAWGFISIGANVEYSMFFIASTGAVTLISNSANVVTGSEIDEKLCIGTSVANPVVIKNALGSTLNVNLILFYN